MVTNRTYVSGLIHAVRLKRHTRIEKVISYARRHMNRRYLQLSLRKERIALEMIPPLQSSHPLREMPSGNEPDPARTRSAYIYPGIQLQRTVFQFILSFAFFLSTNRIKSPSLISLSCHSIYACIMRPIYNLSFECIHIVLYIRRKLGEIRLHMNRMLLERVTQFLDSSFIHYILENGLGTLY